MNYIFLLTETHFPSTKIEVTDRGDVLMPTNFSQLDDEPKETAAGEKDATKYSFDEARLVELVSFCLEEIRSTPIIFVSPTFARVAHTMILILFLSSEIEFLSCDSWTSLFISSIVHLIRLSISQKCNIFF